ncbi:UDP-N-acetylmuramate dehydrogenase [Paenibacillus yanchengensis]|uniref:UDP-N-acetylenolpyruvoylglucosamine reductase n=1 Tax=Paenibacillus yanchengensis TaxID=2035833 RepID=A0ABW4YJ01_9BACL
MDIKSCELMARHTFTRTGGAADLFVQPTTFEEVQQIVTAAKQLHLPITTLGYGTNVIVRDSGIRGIVMNMNKLDHIQVDNTIITAQSGASIIQVSRLARDHHLSGLEFACGIPGSVGGALMMNAGAYGGEVSFVLKEATVLDSSGQLLVLDHTQFNFSYRSSIFEQQHYTVLEAVFELQKAELTAIQSKMDENTMLREQKQPLEYPSCGSVFKRPPNMFAGKLISDSGLMGTRIGGAEVSTKHAGFIVNVDQATSTDYLQLIEHVKQTVWNNYQVRLETEVKIIGDLRDDSLQQ